MTEVESTSSPAELLSMGRRHLAVKDYHAAVEALATACEQLAQEHGDMADQCAEAYLWYGKALLGLSREETGVLGEAVPGTGNVEDDDDDDEEENGENGEDESNEASAEKNGQATSAETEVSPEKSNEELNKVEKNEAESTTKDDEGENKAAGDSEQPGPSNGEAMDESTVNLENDDDVDNLQLAWEMLDLARNILQKRAEDNGAAAARALLADAHLALGEVALESETYDKAVRDMQSCLDIQKELYQSDDRRIAETHYQIGLANSLASNFEDAIIHFKNAANILETRIKILESPTASDDASVKKLTGSDPGYSVEGEIKELKELLPEIQEKIQDMMDYKAETMKRIRESLLPSNGSNESPFSNGASSSSSTSTNTLQPKPAPSDISHLIKRKRKSSTEAEEENAPKKANT